MGWPGEVSDNSSSKGSQAGNDTNAQGAYGELLAQATEQEQLSLGGEDVFEDPNAQTDTSSQPDTGADTNGFTGTNEPTANPDKTLDPRSFMQPVVPNGPKHSLPQASETGSYSYDNKEKLFKLTLTERRPDSVTNRFFENELWGGIGGALSVLPKKIWDFGTHSLDFLKKTDQQHLTKQELAAATKAADATQLKVAQEKFDLSKQESKDSFSKLRGLVVPDFAGAIKGVRWFNVPSALVGTAVKSAFAEKSFLRCAGIGMGWAGAGQTINDLILYNAFRPDSVLKEGLRLPGQPRDYALSVGIPYTLFANLSTAGRLKSALGTVVTAAVFDNVFKPVPKEELAYNHYMQMRGLEASAVGGTGAGIGAFVPGNWAKYLLVIPAALAAKAVQQAVTDPLKVHDKDYGKTLQEDVKSPSDATADSAVKDLKEFAVKGGTGSMEVLDRLATRSIPDVRSSAITHTAMADAKFDVGTRVKRNAAPVSALETTLKTIWHSFTGAYDNHSLDSMPISDPNQPNVRLDFGAGATIDYLIAKNAAQSSHDKGSDLPIGMQKHIDERLDFLFDGKGVDPAEDGKLIMQAYKKMVELTRSKNLPEALNQAKRNEELIRALLIQDPQMCRAELSGWVGRREASTIDPTRLAIENTQGLNPEQIKELRVQAILDANETSGGKLVAKLCRDQALLHMARAYNNSGPNNEYAADAPSANDALYAPWGAKDCLQQAFKYDRASIYNAQLQKIATDLFGMGDLSKEPDPKRSNFGPFSDGPHYGTLDNTSNNAGMAELLKRDQRLRKGGRANPSSGEVQQSEYAPPPAQDWNRNAERRSGAEQNTHVRRSMEAEQTEEADVRRRREAEEYDRNMQNRWKQQNATNDGFMQTPSLGGDQDPVFEQ